MTLWDHAFMVFLGAAVWWASLRHRALVKLIELLHERVKALEGKDE